MISTHLRYPYARTISGGSTRIYGHGKTKESQGIWWRKRRVAHIFGLVIVKGKAYIEKYKKSIQTRDVFTIWGILQLLRRYPGRVPDMELMFDCDDRPVIKSAGYRKANMTLVGPPPLFRYCGYRWTMDIVFPDWSTEYCYSHSISFWLFL